MNAGLWPQCGIFAQTETATAPASCKTANIASDAGPRSGPSKRPYRAGPHVDTAEAAIGVCREAEVAQCRARQTDSGFDASRLASAGAVTRMIFPALRPRRWSRFAPASSNLKTTLPAGRAIMEIGDVSGDLEWWWN